VTENELLSRVRRFDRQALAEVYDAYSDSLYAYAFRLLRDQQQAEDCVSETFTRLLKALQVGKGPDKYLKAYLFRIAHNWITDIFRNQVPLPLPVDEKILPSTEFTENQASRSLMQAQVQAAMYNLTPDQRQVIMLKYVEGWQNEQVAAALQKPVGAVKSLQHRALESLRRMLCGSEDISSEAN
jgi:RNA polymerase sigma-70 factor (ECF subfamily)